MVKGAFAWLSSYEDLESARKFFESKDTRKYKLAASQACDSIQAAADWLDRDSKDVEAVSHVQLASRGGLADAYSGSSRTGTCEMDSIDRVSQFGQSRQGLHSIFDKTQPMIQ